MDASEDYSENVDSSSEDDSDFGGRAKKRTKTTSGAGKAPCRDMLTEYLLKIPRQAQG